jgi:hypothetical protein
MSTLEIEWDRNVANLLQAERIRKRSPYFKRGIVSRFFYFS